MNKQIIKKVRTGVLFVFIMAFRSPNLTELTSQKLLFVALFKTAEERENYL